eukprot:gnl/Dysnectes_brevis/567_a625_5581.p1 GENE.gnl/Dysnectes_brevis/567_a625_5581~~gnl/Dysnectes_brevis/567_a625_5581.p1  ORF type:complete len:284 (-),score=81.34 gnl/Dysnectes_brevis/567_a625_5581:74-925(-)
MSKNKQFQINHCRFYENELPEEHDIVIAEVTRVTDTECYVRLLEFNGKEGMLPLSGLSRKRIRSIGKHVKIGKRLVLEVLRVDAAKGHIDLDKRNISEEEKKAALLRFQHSRAVHSFVRHCSTELRIQPMDLYRAWGWPIAAEHGSLYKGLKKALTAFDDVFGTSGLSKEHKEIVKRLIHMRMSPQPVRVQAEIRVMCYQAYRGIQAIQDALRAGLVVSTEEMKISIRLDVPPIFVISTSTLNAEGAIAAINQCMDIIQAKIVELGGLFGVEKKPRVLDVVEE